MKVVENVAFFAIVLYPADQEIKYRKKDMENRGATYY